MLMTARRSMLAALLVLGVAQCRWIERSPAPSAPSAQSSPPASPPAGPPPAPGSEPEPQPSPPAPQPVPSGSLEAGAPSQPAPDSAVAPAPTPADGPGEAAGEPAPRPQVVMVAGDIAAPGGDQERTAALLEKVRAERGLDAILMLGDGAYRFSNLASYRTLYEPTWGIPAFRAITHPVPGNHEYLEKGNANEYFDYCGREICR